MTKRRYFRIPHLNWNVGYDDDGGIIMEWDWIWLPIFSNLRPSCKVLQAPYHQVHKKIGDAGIHLFFFSFACTTHVSGTKNQLDITMWHKKLKKKKNTFQQHFIYAQSLKKIIHAYFIYNIYRTLERCVIEILYTIVVVAYLFSVRAKLRSWIIILGK